jgi:hypothetical protein
MNAGASGGTSSLQPSWLAKEMLLQPKDILFQCGRAIAVDKGNNLFKQRMLLDKHKRSHYYSGDM